MTFFQEKNVPINKDPYMTIFL